MGSDRFLAATAAGFVVLFVTNAVMAVAVIDPLFSDRYREVVGETTALDLPLLIGGYLLIAVVIAFAYRHHPARPDWVRSGASVGAMVGVATFVGVHTVQAGYTIIDTTAWVLSGVFDTAGPLLAGLMVGYVTDRRAAPPAPSDRLAAHLDRIVDRQAGDPDKLDRHIAELEAVSGQVDTHLDRLRARSADDT